MKELKTRSSSFSDYYDLADRVDCVNRSLANLRDDIPHILHDTILQILKEWDRQKKYVEVGYR